MIGSERPVATEGPGDGVSETAPPSGHGPYRAMLRSLVVQILAVSAIPLAVIAAANFVLFHSLNRQVVEAGHRALLRNQRESIENFLGNLTAQLSTFANQYTLEEMLDGELERVFHVIQTPAGVLTDVGIIAADGSHVRYLGPFDLSRRNYRHTEWFAKVIERGVFVSDVFLGFRDVPHFVIAVKRPQGSSFWILRATVDSDYFSRLVDATSLGHSGEAFIVNGSGLYQTRTRDATELLQPSGYPFLEPHADIVTRTLAIGGTRYLCSTAWMSHPRWLLIFRQPTAEAFRPLRQAVAVGLSMTMAGVVGAALLAVFVARRQVRRIRNADIEKDNAARRLVATGRVAAVGEMSAGLAHEINNPLATIDTLRTWVSDLAASAPVSDGDRREIIDAARKIGEQVERCKTITTGLLRFARRSDTESELVDVNHLLRELAIIVGSRARVEGAELTTDLGEVGRVRGSMTQLQQVFVNLANNAVDAVAHRQGGRVSIVTATSGSDVVVRVNDNGCGIVPENLSRIFEPFFTTKPVGRGTGLGLSICFGLVKEIGGEIRVESEPGLGTTFTVVLPVVAPPEPST